MVKRSVHLAASVLVVLIVAAGCVPPQSIALGPPAQAEEIRPVVIVPGWGLTCGVSPPFEWLPWKNAFLRRGYSESDVAIFGFERCDAIPASAEKLSGFVEDLLEETGAHEIDIVAHSMGSLIARWCVVFGSCGDVTVNFVSLAGANQGTELAHFCPIQFWSEACGAMTPGSEVLQTLNAGDQTPGEIRWQTYVSWCESVILPNSYVALEGAENHLVNHCVMHDDWKRDYQTIPLILDSLGVARTSD